jgi:hypothetical protein
MPPTTTSLVVSSYAKTTLVESESSSVAFWEGPSLDDTRSLSAERSVADHDLVPRHQQIVNVVLQP